MGKLAIYLQVIILAFLWLFFPPSRRKFIKVWTKYKAGGIRLCWYLSVEKFSRMILPYNPFRYQLSPSQSSFILARCSNQPLISIVVPVYKVKKKWLKKCIDSVISQHYPNWELILIDDASRKNDLKQLMDKSALQDNRIRTFYLEENRGIAGATNFGIKQAIGKFIGELDHDDELTPDALTWVVWVINKHPEAVWFYSDEDLITATGRCHSPRFKPDFSSEFLLSNMFTCHFRVYSARILNEVGGIRSGFEGSQDHDLALRISEVVRSDQVIHIPRVLYHWRTVPGSAALSIEEKPQAAISGRKAVEEALIRRKINGTVTSSPLCPTIYKITLQPSDFPKISIIISAKNASPILEKCIRSIQQHTSYPNYEILIVANQSDDSKAQKYLADQGLNTNVRVIPYNKSSNHSEMNNIAVSSTNSDFVVFVNNGIEIISNKWLEQLVASTEIDKSIAIVGCLLLYPNGKVQQAGIILGIHGSIGQSHKSVPCESSGYLGRLHCLQEVSAVTTALALVRRSAFESIGGFDIKRYPTAYNDVDLCIRMKKRGFRCLYNPMVRAVYYGATARSITEQEVYYKEKFVSLYSEELSNDPFYNPNLSLDSEQFMGFRAFPLEKQIPELRVVPHNIGIR